MQKSLQRNRSKIALLCLTALVAFSLMVATAFALGTYYNGWIAAGDYRDGPYEGWAGWNQVSSAYGYQVCAGQATINGNFYGSYSCSSAGLASKSYGSYGNRRARAHNSNSIGNTKGVTGTF